MELDEDEFGHNEPARGKEKARNIAKTTATIMKINIALVYQVLTFILSIKTRLKGKAKRAETLTPIESKMT